MFPMFFLNSTLIMMEIRLSLKQFVWSEASAQAVSVTAEEVSLGFISLEYKRYFSYTSRWEFKIINLTTKTYRVNSLPVAWSLDMICLSLAFIHCIFHFNIYVQSISKLYWNIQFFSSCTLVLAIQKSLNSSLHVSHSRINQKMQLTWRLFL